MDMGKVIIDYEGFKDVLGDYLDKNLIDEIISCMNDNLVFIEDIDEEVSESGDKKAFTGTMTPKKAEEYIREYCRKHPFNIEIVSAMKENRKSVKEVKRYGGSIDYEKFQYNCKKEFLIKYAEKETIAEILAALVIKLECKGVKIKDQLDTKNVLDQYSKIDLDFREHDWNIMRAWEG